MDAALFGGFGRDFDEGIRHLLADSLDTISKVALVKMLEQTPIIQMQIEFRISWVRWFGQGDWEQPRLPVGEGELFRVEQRLIGSVGSDRPLQGLVSFQPLVAHAREQRCQ